MAQFKMVSLKKAEEEDIEDDVASEDANEDSEEEENDSDAGELVAKESEESRTEKLTRTIFIGNLPSNFPLKVFIIATIYCVYQTVHFVGIEEKFKWIWRCCKHPRSLGCSFKADLIQEGGISIVSFCHTLAEMISLF